MCYLLRRFDVMHIYHTTMLGVNPEFETNRYYSRVLPKDCARVQRRFSDAQASGLTVREKSTHISEIIDHLTSTGPVILLTNSNLLHCGHCSKPKRFT